MTDVLGAEKQTQSSACREAWLLANRSERVAQQNRVSAGSAWPRAWGALRTPFSWGHWDGIHRGRGPGCLIWRPRCLLRGGACSAGPAGPVGKGDVAWSQEALGRMSFSWTGEALPQSSLQWAVGTTGFIFCFMTGPDHRSSCGGHSVGAGAARAPLLMFGPGAHQGHWVGSTGVVTSTSICWTPVCETCKTSQLLGERLWLWSEEIPGLSEIIWRAEQKV